ncbi:MAG: VIT domain-containing protein [Polyangiaceae bacterium]
MSSLNTELCHEVDESLGDILDGLAASRLMDHIAECDACRDKRYEAERAVEVVEAAGLDFRVADDFAERMIAAVEAARPSGPTGAIMPPLVRQSGEVARITGMLESPPASQPQSTPIESGARAIDGTAPTMLAPSSLEERLATSGTTEATVDVNRTTLDAGPPASLEGAAEPVTGPNKTVILTPTARSPRPSDAPIVEAITGKADTSKSDPGAGASTLTSDAVDLVRPKRGVGPTIEAEPLPSSATSRRADAAPLGSKPKSEVKTVAPKTSGGRVVSLFRKPVFLGALGTGMAAAAVAGFFLLGKNGAVVPPPPAAAAFVDGAWTGSVESIARAATDGRSGVEVCTGEKQDQCSALEKGGAIAAGSLVRTDARTRARLALVDGTVLSLDRSSEVSFAGGATRQASVRGLVIADVAKADKAVPAKFMVPQGQVEIVDPKVDAKLSITTSDKRAAIEVARSSVKVTNDGNTWAKVRSGEEASLASSGAPTIGARHTMSDMLEWSDQSIESVDGTLKGVGELRAKKPGDTQEKDHAVRLSKHQVKVRVVDVVARTEVDETFTNDSDDTLEGIYRFPLPPDAQIEKLSLEVDGQLVEGAFVDRDRGAAIWRGAIHNATPTAPKPREEIVWVPGPWRDPALLEWQRGGRFELHIFPIPKHGSRRVVLTYTQTVQQSGGVRKFSYPLGLDASASNKIDEFGIDLQVLGLDKGYGLSTRGYQLNPASAPNGGQRVVLDEKNFIPAGDLNVEYALPDRDHDVTTWAYQPPNVTATGGAPPVATTPVVLGNTKADREKIAKANAPSRNDTRRTSRYPVRPEAPRWGEGHERLHVIVVDSSRSMVGERYSRATRLASSLVREMDRRDTFMVMACDTTCQVMGASSTNSLGQVLEPSTESAQEVERFLGTIEPDGGSDPFLAVQAARTVAGNPKGKELRILYLGDGTPTVGPTRASTIEASIKQALPAGDGALIAVALGNDADTTTLAAMARGGGGVMMPYVPGQRVSAAALDVLGAASGSTLSDVQVELPPGLVQVTPSQMDSIPSGGEAFIYARMTSPTVKGTITLRGRVNGDKFEQAYPADITASSDAGNAFVPRLFAASKINDLERGGRIEDKESVIALSQKFAVASRFTSLLVLESEAMFKAFGLERSSVDSGFSGEVGARSASSSSDETTRDREEKAAAEGDFDGRNKDKDAGDDLKKPDVAGMPIGDDGGFASPPVAPMGRAANAGPAPTTAQPASPPPVAETTPTPSPKPATQATGGADDPFSPHWGKKTAPVTKPPPSIPATRLVPMRRVWDRHSTFATTNVTAPTLATALAEAQSASNAAPNSRDKTVSLFKLLVASSQVSDATELASKWSQRDALDPDALIARADVAAMNGDRERALRILSGLADVRPGDKAVQEKLVNTFAALSPDLACQFRVSLADLDPSNVKNVANAAVCTQNLGFLNVSNSLVSSVDSSLTASVTTAMKSVKLAPTAGFGDVRVEATWTGTADLDVAAIDSKGNRISALGSPLKFVSMSCTNARAKGTESCALAGLTSGNYAIEVIRTTPSTEPITGTLKVTSPEGQVRQVPFTLTGTRLEVGSVQVSFTERLVPVNDPGLGAWR